MASLSAAPTANVFISAFSPPVVNAGRVNVVLNGGSSVLHGSVDMLHEMAAGILKAVKRERCAIAGKRYYPADRKSRGPGWCGPRVPRTSPLEPAYLALIAEIEAAEKPLPLGFISRRCEKIGCSRQAFNNWRQSYFKRQAEKSAAEEESTP